MTTREIVTREEKALAPLQFSLTETGHALAMATELGKMVENQFREGHHYMRIPGTPATQRPHLKDQGASLIMNGFKVRTGNYKVLESRWEDEDDHYSIALEAEIIHVVSGVTVSSGVGSATSHEVKYAYRWVQLADVPSGLDRTQLPVRTRKSDGTKLYRVDNPDVGDLYNTLWKMAAKRAEGDAVLKLPGCSELFAGYVVDRPKESNRRPEKTEIKTPTPQEIEKDVDDLYGPKPAPVSKAPGNGPSVAQATPVAPRAESNVVPGPKADVPEPKVMGDLFNNCLKVYKLTKSEALKVLELESSALITDVAAAWYTVVQRMDAKKLEEKEG